MVIQIAMSAGEVTLNAVFYFFAIVLIVCAISVATSKNIVRSAFWLLGVLFSVAALFAILKSDFLFVIQLLVYVGGVLILLLFAVMLTHRISNVKLSNESATSPLSIVGVISVMSVIIVSVLSHPWSSSHIPADVRQTPLVGEALKGVYLAPFEIMSLLLLAGLIAAIYVVRKEIKQ